MFSWGNNRIGPTGVRDAQRRAEAFADRQRQELETLDTQAREHPGTPRKRIAWFLFNVAAWTKPHESQGLCVLLTSGARP